MMRLSPNGATAQSGMWVRRAPRSQEILLMSPSRFRGFSLTAIGLCCCLQLTTSVRAQTVDDLKSRNRHQWRGPEANGVSRTATPPIEWSEGKDIRWKVAIDGNILSCLEDSKDAVEQSAKAAKGANGNAPNVLFLAVDDLNDWVGCLGGHPYSQALFFLQLYCKICSLPLSNPLAWQYHPS